MPTRSVRRLHWGRLLWLVFFLNVGLGLWLSPATAARKVRVVGAQVDDKERIAKAVQVLRRKPAIGAPRTELLGAIRRRVSVSDAEVRQNVLGRALLTIRYSPPVARLASNPNVLLYANGAMGSTAGLDVQLPKLSFFDRGIAPGASIAGAWQPQLIAELCGRVLTSGVDVRTVHVAASGAVRIHLSSGGSVALGAPEYLDEKFAKIDEIRAEKPEVLAGRFEINLMVPKSPVIAPLEK